jgi:hypothetical protein
VATTTPALTADQIDFARNLIAVLQAGIDAANGHAVTTGSTTGSKGKAAPKAKAEPVATEPDAEAERRTELGDLSLAQLKKVMKNLGYTPEDVKGVSVADAIDAIIAAEFEEDDDAEDDEADDEADDDDADADDDDADGEDGEDEELPSVEELTAMNLRTLRKWVADRYDDADLEAAGIEDIKTAERSAILDFLTGGADDDDEDEDDADEDDTDEDDADDADDEDDDEGLTVEDLEAMSLAELKKAAPEYDVQVKKGMTKPQIIKAIVDMSEVTF